MLSALNHLLGQAEWARRHLRPFAGRRACFQMPPWSLSLAIDAQGLLEGAGGEAPPDVLVALPGDGPFLALQGIEALMARAHVTGNAEFATALSFVLKNLRWDGEEDLARLLGDVAAHRIAGSVRALVAWQRQAASALAENAAAYLRDEAALLVAASEFDILRKGIADVEHRLGQVQAQIAVLLKQP